MEAYDALLTRRSIRKYTNEAVLPEMVDAVLRAAMNAPSAGNQQPWHFVVITERTLLDRIPSFHPHSLMVKEAPLAILVCGDPTLEKHKGYWVQDCAAATENLLLAIHAKGLAGVWAGVYPREDRVAGMRALLGIPEHVIPFALVPVGHPAEEKPPAGRWDASRIHRGRW